jgi:uncharacterized protein
MVLGPDFNEGWLGFLDEFAGAHRLPEAGVDLVMKPVHQYLLYDLPMGERIRLLRNHYALMAEFAAPKTVARLWRGETLDAGSVGGKTCEYALCLAATNVYRTRKEGEITVALCEAEGGEALARLTFLLSESAEGRRGLMIGGLQGPRSAAAKQAIVAATRDLHGLRPRDGVLVAAFAIADLIGAREAWAVSSTMHVHRSRERRQQDKLHSDYDSLWLERGARGAMPFGWIFDVPGAPARTGKTSQGRRRDAMKEIIWRLARSAFTGTTVEIADAAALLPAAE